MTYSVLFHRVKAVKMHWPKRTLIAALELHTFSSLNIEFMQQYKGSMDAADTALIYFNPGVVAHKGLAELSTASVQEAFGSDKIQVFDNNSELLKKLKSELTDNCISLIMSSGSFDGIDWKEELTRD